MAKSPNSPSQSKAAPAQSAAAPDAVAGAAPADATTGTPVTAGGPTAAPTPAPAPILIPVVPVAPVTPIATTVISLSTASPSTSTTAPTSSVSVNVPGTTGSIRFSLVVTDNLGQESAPAYVTVAVQNLPIANITASPMTIVEGGAVELSGAASTSTGTIASYTFSLAPIAVT